MGERILGFVSAADGEGGTSGQLVANFQNFSSLLQDFSDLLLSFSQFCDLIGAKFVEGVEEIVHLPVLLIEDFVFLLIFLFSFLVLKNSVEVSQLFLINVDVLLHFLNSELCLIYLFSIFEIEALSSFILAKMRSLASGILRLASLSWIS